MKQRPHWLQGLKNPIFARLYLAQTINLVGDSLTWLGLALLAFELAAEKAGIVLAGALTLRVMAFVVLSPIAGAIADRVDRKHLMIIALRACPLSLRFGRSMRSCYRSMCFMPSLHRPTLPLFHW